jgi:phenylacetate-coenzyme A ligase PaaK-like adenylate-forming protein
MFAVPRDRVVRIHASSGTTGKPTVVKYTQADDTWAHLVLVRFERPAAGHLTARPEIIALKLRTIRRLMITS